MNPDEEFKQPIDQSMGSSNITSSVKKTEKKKVVEELIEDIKQKSEVASKQMEVAAEKKAFLDVQSVIIAQEEAEASKALEEAIPALEAAKEALNNIS